MQEEQLEAEFTTLREAVSRMHYQLDEILAKIARIERATRLPPEEEFRAARPQSSVDPDLIALVGVQPAATVEDDKRQLRKELAERFK
jgi:hypothetical protein